MITTVLFDPSISAQLTLIARQTRMNKIGQESDYSNTNGNLCMFILLIKSEAEQFFYLSLKPH